MSNKPSISSRLPDVGVSIFAIMSKMAIDEGAINLSQGFPDFPVDQTIIDLVNQYMKKGHNQYAPMPGVPQLRNVISDVIARTYALETDPETEITITAGATEGLFAAISALVHAGDEVIMFDPSYDSYDPAIRLSGGIPVRINLEFPDFTIDWSEVERKITSRTKVIMINTPHNPSGAVMSEDDMRTLEQLAEAHNLIVLSDEVYERIIFDDLVHQSVLRFPKLATRSIAVFSFGKTFHATGWKVGYTVAPGEITTEIRKTHQFITFSVNTPVQLALAEYMREPAHYENLGSFYQKKRDHFLEGIKGSSWVPAICHGSYFQSLGYENISKLGDREMAEMVTRVHKVASIPNSVFYGDRTDNKLLRFCFAKEESTMERACEILRKL